MEYAAYGYILIALFGLLFGSFLNVCILRIPEGKSVITGPSHCPSCNRRLRPIELVPVFSWLALRARCRSCGVKISAQYPLIEAANAVLWMLAAYIRGFSPALPLECALLSAFLGLSIIDARTREIPFCFNVFIAVCGILRAGLSVYTGGFWALLPHIIGFFAVSVPIYIIYILSGKRAVGGGDVKLLAAAGLFLGWRLTVLGFFTGCILGSLIHVIRMRVSGAGRTLALGPYLAAGLALSLFFGDSAIAWYLGMIGW